MGREGEDRKVTRKLFVVSVREEARTLGARRLRRFNLRTFARLGMF